MLLTRQQFEEQEGRALASYAIKSTQSKGRQYPESDDPYRTCFQRDRDRIIHTKAFRRLKGKTQVFVAHYGDHYRSRLVHSMEVAQLSRDMARTLNLNEDLTEAIALAHDLGHTPFGHAGQDEMHVLMQEYGDRFEHNEQSRRIVEILEQKHVEHPGLNLSFEVIDGLIKHRTTYDNPLSESSAMPSLEAQLVNMADEIAYKNHDIDDGLRSGILNPDVLESLKLWRLAKTKTRSDLPFELWEMGMISSLVTLMADDLLHNTDRLIQEHSIQTAADVCKTDTSLCCFSDGMRRMNDELKHCLYQNFYQSPGVAEYNDKEKRVIRLLFESFMKTPTLLPDKIRTFTESEPLHVVVKDYIAGMTDNFALGLYDQ